MPEEVLTDGCDIRGCVRPTFKVFRDPNLKNPINYCESHWYAGQLVGAALRKDGQKKYKELLAKMDEANEKYAVELRGRKR